MTRANANIDPQVVSRPKQVTAKAACSSSPRPKPTLKRAPFQPLEVLEPKGPNFDRAQLEILASDKISRVFGPLFEQQDGYHRQCRMPEAPLLLADRVLGIEGEPGSQGTGVCWTETDVRHDSWYLNDDVMPFGIAVEAGQADLLLISWLGCDFLNRNERIYRLLGCEITFHGSEMPTVGETLRYQIHVDGHAKLGDTRMFFFKYDARIGDRLFSSVRHGQAGFFSDEELASSSGVLWSAEEDTPQPDARMDQAPCCSRKRAFDEEATRAFFARDPYRCFGEGFESTAAHRKSPSPPSGKMQLIDRVAEFDPTGGPWGRGYLRAEADVPVDAWFYEGHFKNDPCMPGTLMAEAACQALGFYVAALGFTINRDCWKFMPVESEPFQFICRGQVTPDRAHLVTYEVFVEEIIDGDEPRIYAALLASCDGFKVFLCRRFGMRLVKDWPLKKAAEYIECQEPPSYLWPGTDVRGDHKAMLACALGKPSDASGQRMAALDSSVKKTPRLPSPPYHFLTRAISVDVPPGEPKDGALAICEYDVPPDAWYFTDSGNGSMPFSVLTEVLLQPCGWLSSYLNCTTLLDQRFRNLSGQNVEVLQEVGADAGTITTETRFLRMAKAGSTIIVFFDVVGRVQGQIVARLKTDFGFFQPAALAHQKGLPVTAEERAAIDTGNEIGIPNPFNEDSLPRLARGRLNMVDRVMGYWPDGGENGLGRMIGEQSINPYSWYFKAHFFEDPVQPGSLGLEALYQLFKALVKCKGLANGFQRPRFETPALNSRFKWIYRGQVIPRNKAILTNIEITDVQYESAAVLVKAKGSLWCDGLKIYEVNDYPIRICES